MPRYWARVRGRGGQRRGEEGAEGAGKEREAPRVSSGINPRPIALSLSRLSWPRGKARSGLFVGGAVLLYCNGRKRERWLISLPVPPTRGPEGAARALLLNMHQGQAALRGRKERRRDGVFIRGAKGGRQGKAAASSTLFALPPPAHLICNRPFTATAAFSFPL